MTVPAEKSTNNQEGDDGAIPMINVDLAANADNDEKTGVTESKTKCCNVYDGYPDASGYSWLGVGRGMMVMSNIFISSSFLFLASEAAGCGDVTDGKVCTNKIYGFAPSSLITNIAVVAGLASAFFMPIGGALVDFTPYRRSFGIVTAIVLIAIQACQIFTNRSTWFTMAVLQSIAAFFYQLQVVAVFAYLPDISGQVGELKMNRFTSNFAAAQFGAQFSFLLVIAVIAFVAKTDAVVTGQISQALNTFTSILFFGIGWLKYMTPRPATRDLPEGQNLLTEGFREIWHTSKKIQRHFKKGLRWYYLALAFAEATAQAVTTAAIVYLNDTLKLDSLQISLFFLITLAGTLPGTQVGWLVTSKSNPNTSWKLCMVYLCVVLVIGALVLEDLPKYCSFIWGLCVGIGLGWFYPTENMFFSMCLPKGQEAELAGFYVYCSQILAWLPPLIFTLMLQYNIAQKYALIATSMFFLPAIGFLMCAASWDEIVEEATSGALSAADEAKTKGLTSAASQSKSAANDDGDDSEKGRVATGMNDEASA